MIDTGPQVRSKIKALFGLVVVAAAGLFWCFIYPVTFGHSTWGHGYATWHLGAKNWPRLSHETMMYIHHQVRKFHQRGETPKVAGKGSSIFWSFFFKWGLVHDWNIYWNFVPWFVWPKILIGCCLVSCLVVCRRSIGVITKIDIMDQGTDAVKMLLDLKKNCVFLLEGLHIAF